MREGYAFEDGDYQRVKNQQLFIKAVMAKSPTAETLTNPLKINDVISQVSPYLSVDDGLNGSIAAGLGLSLRNIRTDDVNFFTLPNLGTGTSDDGQSIVIRDDAAIAEISEAFDDDRMGEFVEGAGLEN